MAAMAKAEPVSMESPDLIHLIRSKPQAIHHPDGNAPKTTPPMLLKTIGAQGPAIRPVGAMCATPPPAAQSTGNWWQSLSLAPTKAIMNWKSGFFTKNSAMVTSPQLMATN